jgi:multidrug efflux pump subunit AcrA (membrane-fusion protein)
MGSRDRIGTAVVVVVACLAMPILGLAQSNPEPPSSPTSASEDELLLEGPILKTIESTSVAAHVAGVIAVLEAKEGTAVTRGQEIGRIHDLAVKLQSEKAKVALDIARKKQGNDIDVRLAEKSKSVAENDYRRALEANQKVSNVYPVSEMDRLRLVYDRTILEAERAAFLRGMANLDVSTAELEYKQAQELVQRHRILAPCNGVIVSLEKRVGEWVDPGTVILKVVQIDRLRVEGFLHARRATADLMGTKASVRFEESIPGQPFEAEVVFISPDVNPLNGQVRVFLEIDNPGRKLRPGLRPRVAIAMSKS